jgi:hypothetical protein
MQMGRKSGGELTVRDGSTSCKGPARPGLCPTTERVARSGVDECLVTKEGSARDQIVRGPLRNHVSGRHLKAGGLSPLSFAYFSLRRQRKVGAAPHRGNTNKPIRKQGKANAQRKTTRRAPQAKKLSYALTKPQPEPQSLQPVQDTQASH